MFKKIQWNLLFLHNENNFYLKTKLKLDSYLTILVATKITEKSLKVKNKKQKQYYQGKLRTEHNYF